MWLELLLAASGIFILLVSGEVLVRHSSLLAHSLGIPTLVVGLTVVAFGTSAPELAVNIMAALGRNSGITFGNIIGSNIANIGLIIGSSAIYSTMQIKKEIVKTEMPRMLIVTLVFFVLMIIETPKGFNRTDGAILLGLFVIYLYLMYREVVRGAEHHTVINKAATQQSKFETNKKHKYVLLTIAGLVGLWIGGELTVTAAIALARLFNVPPEIIGLSVIAIGTSLPELVVSVIAAIKGETSLAIGNIVGSNIFNLLLVGGACSLIAPFNMPVGGYMDLMVMGGFSIALVYFAWTHDCRIKRWEGALLLFLYLSYLGSRIYFS